MRRDSCLPGRSNVPILLQPPPGRSCSRFPRSINPCLAAPTCQSCPYRHRDNDSDPSPRSISLGRHKSPTCRPVAASATLHQRRATPSARMKSAPPGLMKPAGALGASVNINLGVGSQTADNRAWITSLLKGITHARHETLCRALRPPTEVGGSSRSAEADPTGQRHVRYDLLIGPARASAARVRVSGAWCLGLGVCGRRSWGRGRLLSSCRGGLPGTGGSPFGGIVLGWGGSIVGPTATFRRLAR